MLNDYKWDLLDELCNILAPFEKATWDFSGNTYVTLSQMIPIITSLISSLEVSDDFYLYEEESDNETIISDSKEINQQTELNYDNITEILKNVKKSIYISLKYYWAIPNEFDIIAAFLDSWYKNLNFISNSNIKERI